MKSYFYSTNLYGHQQFETLGNPEGNLEQKVNSLINFVMVTQNCLDVMHKTKNEKIDRTVYIRSEIHGFLNIDML